MSKIIRTLIAGLVMLSAMAILTTPALGINLWVVPENPTGYLNSSDDFVLEEVVIEEVYMGRSFTGNILILYQEGVPEFAQDVYIKFLVQNESDALNIDNIIIGTAKLIEPVPGSSPIITDPNTNSSLSAETLDFIFVSRDSPVPEGYGVNYSVGDIPWSGGPSETGNPDEDNFNPDNASYYVSVPFTINFHDTPNIGFALYVYAENDLEKQEGAKTVYSHDGVIYHTPEFSTIALPIAAIIGIMFILQSRKRKED